MPQAGTGSRHGEGSAAGRETILRIAVFGLALLSTCVSSFAEGFDRPWVFTGRDHVDLKWDPPPSTDRCTVLRDGVVVATFGPGTTFYRDAGLSEGTTYTHRICATNDALGVGWCGQEHSTTVGTVLGGTIYQDLTWDSGTFELTADVRIFSNATLRITSGATVRERYHGQAIEDKWGGTLHITGGTFHSGVHLTRAASSVSGCTFGSDGRLILHCDTGVTDVTGLRVNPGASVHVNGAGDYHITDCDFQSAPLYVSLASQTLITSNRFTGGWIEATDATAITLAGNEFDDCTALLQRISNATVEGNNFRPSQYEARHPLRLYESPAIIEGNLFDSTAGGIAVEVGGVQVPAKTTIQANFIRGFERGIWLGASSTLPNTVDVLGNDILNNLVGVSCHGDELVVQLHDNCFHANQVAGLETVSRTLPLDVTGNYWGDPSGPTHTNNPAGTGDAIAEQDAPPRPVDFSGFLTSGNCASSLLPPDLRVVDASMVQVIEGVEELVEAKPLAVKAVIASDEIAEPFIVRLTYNGTAYESFYELIGGNLGDQMELLQSETTLSFDNPGEKIVYFFPPDAPFGDSVTATIRVDPGHVHEDPDPQSNSKTWSQPVARTRWVDRDDDEFAHILRPGVAFTRDPQDLGWLQNLARLMDLAPSFLPVAPLDYQWRYIFDKWGPHRRDPKGVYRSVKGALPEATKVINICEQSLSGEVPVVSVANTRILVNVLFDEERAEPPGSYGAALSGLLQIYGVPAVKSALPVADGIDVSRRRILDDDLAQVSAGRRVYSVMGKLDARELEWLDEASYRKLLTDRKVPAAAMRFQGEGATSSGPIVIVSGIVERGAGVSLDPLIPIADGVPDIPVPGDYALLFLGSGGQTLASHNFSPAFVEWSPAGFMASEIGTFAFSVPWHTSTAKLHVTGPTGMLYQATTSDNAPTVEVLYPNGWEVLSGSNTITWSGSDLDGDDLVYSVFLSTNGGADWMPLAADVAGTTLDWHANQGPGGTADCLIKVVACDGILGAHDQSDNGLSILTAGPDVSILRPIPNAKIPAGSVVNLWGVGWDDEDGLLGDASLTWNSNLDGALGAGQVLSTVLSEGDHAITLTGSDLDGYTDTAQTTVHVRSTALPDAGISSTGFRFPERVFLGQVNQITVIIDNQGPACSLNLVMLANALEAVSVPVELDAYSSRQVAVEWTPTQTGWVNCDFRLRNITPADGYSNNDGAYAYRLVEEPGPDDQYDTDGDLLPNWWETLYFGDPTTAAWNVDSDSDGPDNLEEFWAGTLPTAAWSRLQLEALRQGPGGSLQLQWQTVPGKTYRLWHAPDMSVPSAPVVEDVPAAHPSSVLEVPHSTEASGVYHIRLD